MKCAELVGKLSQLPGDLEVCFLSPDLEREGDKEVYNWRKMKEIEHMTEEMISLECDPYILVWLG